VFERFYSKKPKALLELVPHITVERVPAGTVVFAAGAATDKVLRLAQLRVVGRQGRARPFSRPPRRPRQFYVVVRGQVTIRVNAALMARIRRLLRRGDSEAADEDDDGQQIHPNSPAAVAADVGGHEAAVAHAAPLRAAMVHEMVLRRQKDLATVRFRGSDAVNWMLFSSAVQTEEGAIAAGAALMRARIIAPVGKGHNSFTRSAALYSFMTPMTPEELPKDAADEPAPQLARAELEALAARMAPLLHRTSQRHYFRVFSLCFNGEDVLQFLRFSGVVRTNQAAVAIGDQMVRAKVLERVPPSSDSSGFVPSSMYRLASEAASVTHIDAGTRDHLSTVAAKMRKVIRPRSHTHNTRTEQLCFPGSDAVNFLRYSNRVPSVDEAVSVMNQMLAGGLIAPVASGDGQSFNKLALYRFAEDHLAVHERPSGPATSSAASAPSGRALRSALGISTVQRMATLSQRFQSASKTVGSLPIAEQEAEQAQGSSADVGDSSGVTSEPQLARSSSVQLDRASLSTGHVEHRQATVRLTDLFAPLTRVDERESKLLASPPVSQAASPRAGGSDDDDDPAAVSTDRPRSPRHGRLHLLAVSDRMRKVIALEDRIVLFKHFRQAARCRGRSNLTRGPSQALLLWRGRCAVDDLLGHGRRRN
jgi:hypothetical protein